MLDKLNGVIWYNGKFVDWASATCHILTHTLHYGSGVFEGERAYNGKVFKMNEHHIRFHASAEMLDFKIPYSVEELNAATIELIKKNNLINAYLRPIAWHGAEALGIASNKNSINVAIAAWEWNSYFNTGETGIKLMWSDWLRPAPNMIVAHAKANGQYITGTISKNKAEKSGFNDALMLDYRGYVAECTGANIFFAKNSVIYTPIPDCFLNGITRQTIIELIKENNMPIIEKHVNPSEIIAADEIFITGTAVEVQPITQLGNNKYEIGPITKLMIEKYRKLCIE